MMILIAVILVVWFILWYQQAIYQPKKIEAEAGRKAEAEHDRETRRMNDEQTAHYLMRWALGDMTATEATYPHRGTTGWNPATSSEEVLFRLQNRGAAITFLSGLLDDPWEA